MKVAVVLCLLIVAAAATPEDPCDDGCPRIQAPVCGYNTEPEDVVAAACSAIAATAAPQLKFPQFNRRFQPSYSMIRCSRSCTQNYAPVCGYDNNPSFGEQFTNECFLQMYVCEDRGGQPFRDVLRGECFKPI
ncbi:unnamed protein product [Chironomus riparius]|uniref:Kazal-like domain-containing protein n=1 Tax=Chironomus riparius TaxID=315576 RepID=A0A9N9S389_9DIPT|nr:unnamed protein product [Chironomus riparius]